ncbi:redoxin domain-containing protein [Rhodocyclus tenuis]|uniref:peroxiredoxin n=1 Tax=Rhodocyclus gracilis TaxID=2929842 RepID=UPI0012988C4F|nr:peroxiredoxin [Rhodocyclus gracilis]MRD73698.1 redoxin domain-containing protein [Rhodocyclus gracilis]
MIKRLLIGLCFGLVAFAGMPGAAVNAQAAEVPAVGTMAPGFALPDQDGREVRLDSLQGKWVVLYFYPKDDTPGCTQEACSFRDDFSRISALGARILGVSVDDSASHAAFARKHRLPFPLLADRKGVVAQRYGAFSDFGVISFARRYTFLIDPQGKIAKTYLSVDTEQHAADVIADLKRLTGKP